MPSPEELGLLVHAPAAAPIAASLDWNAAHQEVHRLGATNFNLSRLPQGGFQATLVLPTADPSRQQHIEASAGSEAEAVRLALERAERWSTPRQ
jgi:hypothetical protein